MSNFPTSVEQPPEVTPFYQTFIMGGVIMGESTTDENIIKMKERLFAAINNQYVNEPVKRAKLRYLVEQRIAVMNNVVSEEVFKWLTSCYIDPELYEAIVNNCYHPTVVANAIEASCRVAADRGEAKTPLTIEMLEEMLYGGMSDIKEA